MKGRLAKASVGFAVYPTLLITDAAINIFPDLEAKRDIVQNAIDLFREVA
ncbi:MAG: hypothetical protein WAJ91_12650 [Rhodoplanes sp.]